MKFLLFISTFWLISSSVTAQSMDVTSITDATVPDSIFYDLTDLSKPPSFPGGQPAWAEYLREMLKNAAIPSAEQRSTDVKMTFIVEKDGRISNKRVVWNRGPLLHVVLDAIDRMPCWIPGMKDGQPVRVWYYLPIHICLE